MGMQHCNLDEETRLLQGTRGSDNLSRDEALSTASLELRRGRRVSVLERRLGCLSLLLIGGATLLFLHMSFSQTPHAQPLLTTTEEVPLLGKSHKTKSAPDMTIPLVEKRCEWLVARFHERDVYLAPDERRKRYMAQSTDPNVFYRATALIFWQDFVLNGWGAPLHAILHNDQTATRDSDDELFSSALDPLSTFTWVTGDQHLSNFGAWRNRHGDVVFGVNDFDEAAIYDFQVDVLRIAVSICNHAETNGLSHKHTKRGLKAFAMSYVQTVLNYVDNEKALLFELTPSSAYGTLHKFLRDVSEDNSIPKQLAKFTFVNRTTMLRQFRKGSVTVPHSKTNLAAVSPTVQSFIRDAFTSTKYGATMMKLGWQVPGLWDPNFFTVLDVAARIGSGVGSFGVDRYYVLLKGKDTLLTSASARDHGSVILDVKYQPQGAVMSVLSLDETAWYNVLFPNDAARVVDAQRKLTSYTDPYTGWVLLPDDHGILQPFSIRQRSPWKDSPDLGDLTDKDDFTDFVEQVAAATATSHVRGTVAKAPGDFKHAIQNIFEKDHKKLKAWVKMLAKLAFAYREQVLLDYECLRDFVHDTYLNNSTR